MATPIPSTYLKNPEKAQAERKWHVIDVAGLTPGDAQFAGPPRAGSV